MEDIIRCSVLIDDVDHYWMDCGVGVEEDIL